MKNRSLNFSFKDLLGAQFLGAFNDNAFKIIDMASNVNPISLNDLIVESESVRTNLEDKVIISFASD